VREQTWTGRNKALAAAATKDELLEYISEQLEARDLGLEDIQAIDPSIRRRSLSRIRTLGRSVASVERLESFSRALGWSDRHVGVAA
jgi:hypothetical protein